MNTQTDTEEIKLEDLNFFWTTSGVPCFMADRDNIEEIVENLGFNIYYLICNVATDRKIETKNTGYTSTIPSQTTTTYVTDLSTSIVKVVNNFVGRSVSLVKDEDIYSFAPVREEAEYDLPPIPMDIVQKLDEFFRLVDSQHGTESIVLLTFDPSKDDSSGWGVLVPDQTNTSVHCKYDAESIVEQKPDHVMIVGSVHSHPNMAAYASGTDHADQADFDGIHITYGWQKSVNGGATQYHIEMQIGGSAYTLKPEEVFEDFVFNKEPDPEVLEWSQKVKKVQPPTGGHRTTAATSSAQVSYTQHQTTTTTRPGYTPAGTTDRFKISGDCRFQSYPNPEIEKAVELSQAVVIMELDYKDLNLVCFSCANLIRDDDLYNQVCPVCDIMFCDIGDGYSHLLSDAASYLRVRNMSTNLDYYLWSVDNEGKEYLARIAEKSYEPEKSIGSLILEDEYPVSDNVDEYYYSGFNEDYTICCGIHVSALDQCNCDTPVIYEDIFDFDQAHPYDVYGRNSECIVCAHYYSSKCTPYKEAIINFVRTRRPIENPISVCSEWIEYDENTYLEKGYLYD